MGDKSVAKDKPKKQNISQSKQETNFITAKKFAVQKMNALQLY